MIDFRSPIWQKKLNRMTAYAGLTSRLNDTRVPNRIITYNQNYFRNCNLPTINTVYTKTISETSPFDVTPEEWQRINQPDVLYIYKTKNLKPSKLQYMIAQMNKIITTRWMTGIKHIFFEQLSDDMLIMGSTRGQK